MGTQGMLRPSVFSSGMELGLGLGLMLRLAVMPELRATGLCHANFRTCISSTVKLFLQLQWITPPFPILTQCLLSGISD